MNCPPYKILGTILEKDDGRTSTNGPITRKLIMMHKVIHLRDNIDRLYMSRKEGFSGLASIEDSIATAIRGIEDNTKKKEQRKTNFSDQKQHKQHEDQQNNTNYKLEMGRKTTVWIFQATNKQNFTRENVNMIKKGKP